MDQPTKEFFRQQQLDVENQRCMDTNTANPQWASVSHGCYISLEASGVHRGLGVHISFVRSTTMDSWKPAQRRLMEVGGNRRLREFFRSQGIRDNLPIQQKYNTRAAQWYRRYLRSLAEGTPPPPPLPEGTGHLPASDRPNSPTALWQDFPAPGERPTAAAGTSLPGRAAVEQARSGIYEAGGSRSSYHLGSAADVPTSTPSAGPKQAPVAAVLSGPLLAISEAAEKTISFVNEGGGKAALDKTTEVIGTTARTSVALAGTGIDWVANQIGMQGPGAGAGNAQHLQGLSTGTMEGFGSDGAHPEAKAVGANSGPAPAYATSYHDASPMPAPPGGAIMQPAALGGVAASPPPVKAVDLWNDEDWGEWH